MDFGYQNEGKLVPKLDQQKLMLTLKDDFCKIVLSLQRGLDFSRFGGPSWEPKSIKNRSKNAIQDGMHLDIDFFTILMDFGTQLGMPNPPKSVRLAWPGVMRLDDKAWRGVVWCDEMWWDATRRKGVEDGVCARMARRPEWFSPA